MCIAHRRLVARVWVALGVLMGLAGCRGEKPSEPNGPAVPKIPVAAPEKERPSITPGRPKPVLPATGPAVAVFPPTSAPLPGAVDDQDAPDAPPFFPRGRGVRDWVKHEPIKTALPDDLARCLPAKTVAVIEPYQIKQVSTCAYRRGPEDRPQVVRVLLIRTHRPEDAYGIFTVLGTGPLSKGAGLLTRTDIGREGLTMHVWKGRHYVQLASRTIRGPTFTQACRTLCRKITFLMPDASPPALIEALPQAGLVRGRQWLVRGWASLAGPGAAALQLPEGKRAAGLLGLDKDSQMVVATYETEGLARPHLVWVVRYDTPEQARKAHRGYQAFLDQATDRASASTMLLRPRGQYLIGTWTAEEESLARVLPKLRSNLE